jgi:hypothetical protein
MPKPNPNPQPQRAVFSARCGFERSSPDHTAPPRTGGTCTDQIRSSTACVGSGAANRPCSYPNRWCCVPAVTDDAVTSVGLGEWERVNEMGDHLTALAQVIKRRATNTRAALDAEWATIHVDNWKAEA